MHRIFHLGAVQVVKGRLVIAPFLNAVKELE
jgi:hypothetical protein